MTSQSVQNRRDAIMIEALDKINDATRDLPVLMPAADMAHLLRRVQETSSVALRKLMRLTDEQYYANRHPHIEGRKPL